ncbi:hypothetical protein [Solidesulfovibrio sp. C21]|uniref:hypothetical protein n=1 Tax=Solidesulfovibrio sp. C21 TaxID=3398613 RepID=UPI0039FCFBA7
MIDAVDSGGYGVLGLYAAQAPVVPDPPVRAASATGAAAGQVVAAVPPVQEAAAVGSGPVSAGEASQDGAATGGRDFAGQGQALARQVAVAVSLTVSTETSPTNAASASDQGTSGTAQTRALRAYARNGETTASRSAPMLTAQA